MPCVAAQPGRLSSKPTFRASTSTERRPRRCRRAPVPASRASGRSRRPRACSGRSRGAQSVEPVEVAAEVGRGCGQATGEEGDRAGTAVAAMHGRRRGTSLSTRSTPTAAMVNASGARTPRHAASGSPRGTQCSTQRGSSASAAARTAPERQSRPARRKPRTATPTTRPAATNGSTSGTWLSSVVNVSSPVPVEARSASPTLRAKVAASPNPPIGSSPLAQPRPDALHEIGVLGDVVQEGQRRDHRRARDDERVHRPRAPAALAPRRRSGDSRQDDDDGRHDPGHGIRADRRRAQGPGTPRRAGRGCAGSGSTARGRPPRRAARSRAGAPSA